MRKLISIISSRLAPYGLIAGIIITASLVNNAMNKLLAKEDQLFRSHVNEVHASIRQRLGTVEEALHSLATLFNSSARIDSEQFRLFSAEILSRHEVISTIQYLPQVTFESRGQFESDLHEQGYITFSVTELRDKKYLTAPPRGRYFPVLYQEPFTPLTASRMGYDILSNPYLEFAALESINNFNVVSTFIKDVRTEKYLHVFAKAIYAGKEELLKEMQLKYDVNGLLMIHVKPELLLSKLPSKELLLVELELVPVNKSEKSIKVAKSVGSHVLEDTEWTITTNKSVEILQYPGADIRVSVSSPVHWQDLDRESVMLNAVLGLLLTTLLFVGTKAVSFRTRKLEEMNQEITALVDQRTTELSHEKAMLESEMQVREQTELRLVRQQEAMLELSALKSDGESDLHKALQRITETASYTLGVQRVGVWLFGNEATDLNCTELFEQEINQHSSGLKLLKNDYPVYFDVISEGRAVSIDDTLRDSRTLEFMDNYFTPLGITAMLDVPLKRGGKVIGVLCHEYIGGSRNWSLDEENFASSVADFIILSLEWHERKQAESKTLMLSSAMEHAADSVFITDVRGIIEYVNPAFEKITGYRCDEVLGKKSNIIKSGKHDAQFYSGLWKTILSGTEYRDIFINRKKDGALYYEEKTITPLFDDNGKLISFVSTGKDITERMQTQQRLHFLAHHDLLTELPNRAMLLERLNHAMQHAHDIKTTLAILFLDLDRFKIINDTLGHHAGDRLLQQVALRLRPCVRKSDTVARIGGDEFILLLEDSGGIAEVSRIASKILETLSRSFTLDEQELFVSGSIGISFYPTDAEDANSLVKNADAAMYRAKEQGRNNYQFYSSEMSSRTIEHLNLETDLRRAVEREEFELHYQPQVNLVTGHVTGTEALIRWQHPQRGMVSPVEFIPLMEENGMIIRVGEWVLRQACIQNKKWQEQGLAPIPVSVNISARQFSAENLAENISAILEETDLAPEYLDLEITESVIMKNPDSAIKTLTALESIGVRFAVDDFGTGYSSLSYLKRFPIHTLKIDRSFVRDITTDSDDAAIVSTVITMAHSLKLAVIAEGVETEQQAEFLRERDCDIGQGYLYSRPVPANDVADLLSGHSLTGKLSSEQS